jgi:hypothetical protein
MGSSRRREARRLLKRCEYSRVEGIVHARIVARVVTVQNPQAHAKAGVTLRESLTAGSAHVILDVEPSGNVEFMTRAATGGSTSCLGGASPAAASMAEAGAQRTDGHNVCFRQR